MSKEITVVIEKEVSPIVRQAQELKIGNVKDMEKATETLSKLNLYNDRITEEKEKITIPAQAVLTAERARWSPIEKPIKLAIDLIRGKMSEYQTMLMKMAKEEEDRIASRIGAGKGKLSVETAVRKMSEVEKPQEKTITDSGSIKFRETQIVKIVDKSKIPLDYLIVDESAILKALKEGKKVTGCVLDIKMTPINNR